MDLVRKVAERRAEKVGGHEGSEDPAAEPGAPLRDGRRWLGTLVDRQVVEKAWPAQRILEHRDLGGDRRMPGVARRDGGGAQRRLRRQIGADDSGVPLLRLEIEGDEVLVALPAGRRRLG